MTGPRRDTREVLQVLVCGLMSHTAKEFDKVCEALGLPIPTGQQVRDRAKELHPDDAELGKREHLDLVFDLLPESEYRPVLDRFLARGLDAVTRGEVQDLLWDGDGSPVVNARARREVARVLDDFELGAEGPQGFMSFLNGLFALDVDAYPRSLEEMVSDLVAPGPGFGFGSSQTLRREIQQHVLSNRRDWDTVTLFEMLKAFEISDARFVRLVEGLVSGRATPNEPVQRAMVAAINAALSTSGLQLSESGVDDGGYPAFRLVGPGQRSRPPSLVLFASHGRKPELRLRDVLDKEIEVLSRPDVILRYDRPIGQAGLTWRDLRDWAGTSGALGHQMAWGELQARLWRSVEGTNSPVQKEFFSAYVAGPGKGLDQPALLPEVWVHWDPRSRWDEDRLLTQRMDFLIFLPGWRRVVIEIDGAQHYSKQGKPSPSVYAKTMAGDRDLRLSGYEVYRFGGCELSAERAADTVEQFFGRLFRP